MADIAQKSPVAVCDLDVIAPQAHAWWRHKLGITGAWPAENIPDALAYRFASILVEDPEALAAVRGRSCVYLANHQVGVESYLFSILMTGLGNSAAPVIAKVEHRNTWIGRIVTHNIAYPGAGDPDLMILVDRENPASVARAFDELTHKMRTGNQSIVVHVDGTRATTCRQPTTRLSPALIDMALAAEAPVVPVRFARGLPVDASPTRLEFPVGYGRQEYWVGRPIHPEQLRRLKYLERKDAVLAAINRLGPDVATEIPAAPDTAFGARVADWVSRTGAEHEFAVIYVALTELPKPNDTFRRLLDGARAGALAIDADPASQWLGKWARWLYGPRGPEVIGLRDTKEHAQ